MQGPSDATTRDASRPTAILAVMWPQGVGLGRATGRLTYALVLEAIDSLDGIDRARWRGQGPKAGGAGPPGRDAPLTAHRPACLG